MPNFVSPNGTKESGLAFKFVPSGDAANDDDDDDDDDAPPPLVGPGGKSSPAPKPAPKPTAAAKPADDDDDGPPPLVGSNGKPAPAPAAAAKPAAKPAPAAADDDDGPPPLVGSNGKPAPAPAAAAAAAAKPAAKPAPAAAAADDDGPPPLIASNGKVAGVAKPAAAAPTAAKPAPKPADDDDGPPPLLGSDGKVAGAVKPAAAAKPAPKPADDDDGPPPLIQSDGKVAGAAKPAAAAAPAAKPVVDDDEPPPLLGADGKVTGTPAAAAAKPAAKPAADDDDGPPPLLGADGKTAAKVTPAPAPAAAKDEDEPPPLIGKDGKVSGKPAAAAAPAAAKPAAAADDEDGPPALVDEHGSVIKTAKAAKASAASGKAVPSTGALPCSSTCSCKTDKPIWELPLGVHEKLPPLVAPDEFPVTWYTALPTAAKPAAATTAATAAPAKAAAVPVAKVPAPTVGKPVTKKDFELPDEDDEHDEDDERDGNGAPRKARKAARKHVERKAGPEVAEVFKSSMPAPIKKVEPVVELPPFKAPCARPGCAHPWVYSTDVFYELICTEQPNDDMSVEDQDVAAYHITRCHKSCLDKVEAERGVDEFGNKRCPIADCKGLLRMRCYVRVNEKRARDVKAREQLHVRTADDVRLEREAKDRAAAAAAAEEERIRNAADDLRKREADEAARKEAEQNEKKKLEQQQQAERKRLAAEKAAAAKKATSDKAAASSSSSAAAAGKASNEPQYNEHGELLNSNAAIKRAEREKKRLMAKQKTEQVKQDHYINPAMLPKGKGVADENVSKIVKTSGSSAAPAEPKQVMSEEEQLRLARGELEGVFITKPSSAADAAKPAKAAKKKAKKANAAANSGSSSSSSASTAGGGKGGTLDQKAARVMTSLAREDIEVTLDTCISALNELAGNVEMAIELVRRREVMRAAGIIEDPKTPQEMFQVLDDEGWGISLDRCKNELTRMGGNAQLAMRNLRLEASERLNANAAATAAADEEDEDGGADDDDQAELLALIAKSAQASIAAPQPQPSPPKPQPVPVVAEPAATATATTATAADPLFAELERAQREQEAVLARFQSAPRVVPAPAPQPPISAGAMAEFDEQQALFLKFSYGNTKTTTPAPAPTTTAPPTLALFGNVAVAPFLGVSGVVQAPLVVAAAAAVPTAPAVVMPAVMPAVLPVAEQVEQARKQLREHLGSHFSPDDIESALNAVKPRMQEGTVEWQAIAVRMIEKQDHEALQCVVCEERMVSIKSVLCEHAVLCGQCLTHLIEMVEKRKTAAVCCPLCRGPLTNVTEVKAAAKSETQLAHERAQLLLSLDNAARVHCAVRMAASGFSLRMCLLALADANDDMPAAAILLQQRAPHYIRAEHMNALEKVVLAEVTRLVDAANAIVQQQQTADDNLFAAQF